METENVMPDSGSSFGSSSSGACSSIEKIRDAVADTLQNTAAKLNEKATAPDAQPSMARYAKQASEWLEESAESVRGFDYERTDTKIRDYVSLNPGRSLLMAGAAGLVVGILLRRR